MLPEVILKTLIACLPVIALVLVLHHLDSHRLLGTRFMLKVFLSGAVIAVISAFVNGLAIDFLQINFVSYTRYASPIIEEALKASVLVVLFRTSRIGFLIDAGILGGCGFFIRRKHLLSAHGLRRSLWHLVCTGIRHGHYARRCYGHFWHPGADID